MIAENAHQKADVSEIGDVFERQPVFRQKARNQKRQCRRQMCRKARGQPIAQRTHDCTQNMPSRPTIGVKLLDDFIDGLAGHLKQPRAGFRR